MLANIAMPRVSLPSVKIPRLEFPAVKLGLPSLPKLRLPRLALPSIALPTLALPKFSIPQYSLPKLSIPTYKLPRMSFPKMTLPRLPRVHITAPTIPSYITLRYLKLFTLTLCLCLCIGVLFIEFSHFNAVRASALSTLNAINTQESTIASEASINDQAAQLNAMAPASGEEGEFGNRRYPVEEDRLDVEAVLIPRENTVISSSRDSKIKTINFDNGQIFKKGDILVEYDCSDVQAEVDIAKQQQELTSQKAATGYKLFKLDILSDVEKLELESEDKQAQARINLYQSRMSDCFIRADYDGRIVKRLANPGEFTRTDRVLMEVASLNHLKAEFLLPSRWLRWVNVDAPIRISIEETDATYDATIKYIYGEVDPVSRSIQITAQLAAYDDRLLPGMSGKAIIDIAEIRESGIYGFLEEKPDGHGH